MASLLDEQTQFLDAGGKPLVNGFLYIGTQNADPKLNPISIYSDRALTTTIANPQTLDDTGRTTNKIWVAGRYSMKVENVNNVQQYQELDNGQSSDTNITTLENVQGANTITATAAVTITAYTDKEQYVFTTAQINTDAVTLNIDGVGAKAVQKNSNQALVPGDFQPDSIEVVAYNSTLDVFEWLNRRHTILPASEVTIASGAIAATRLAHIVDTEGDAAADNLDNITTTGLSDGTTLRISSVNASRVVTVRSAQGGAGQIHLAGEYSAVLDDTDTTLQLVLRGADWYEVGNRKMNFASEQASTSGTAIAFTDIPANTFRITVTLANVSLNGTDDILVQLGDSGGLETSGYQSGSSDSAAGVTSTSGLIMKLGNASNSIAGSMILTHIGDNKWAAQHGAQSGTGGAAGGGFKTLSAELDRLSVVLTGANNFDAGAVGIFYEVSP